ncbi:IS1182 family transposase [Mucilaginibacter sp. McL0603]|uniref:IS1182 family transposase n=1 Tax=Mucilaginibacter sp. McL0603 TaxID=3415670 RepID=UPI003CF6EB5B
MQGKKTYQEKLFVNFQLSDYVPADNFYRRLKEQLDLRFIYPLTAEYYGTEGQKSIDPVVFMKLMLVGYLENLNSDRRIISASRLRMDILYFIGYDLGEELPWHSTVSRTRQLYGEHVFTAVFKRVLKQCIDKGMISGRRQAVDGFFIKANASLDSMVEKEILEDATTFGRELKANEDEDKESPVLKLKEKQGCDDKGLKLESNPGNDTHYSPSDPDAKMSVKPGKPTALNYLGQVSVDTASHMITCAKVFLADKRDSQCLPAVLTYLTSNLKENDIAIQEVIADTNYSSGTALKTLQAIGITAYIPNTGRFKFEREGFIYHSEDDYYECRNGKALTFSGISENDKRYVIAGKHCQGCPFKNICIGDKKYMAIKTTIDKPYYDQMHLRMQTKKAARLMKKRQSTVEPVIGTLVNYLGIKKVNSKGLDQANKCLNIAATAYNLKKLLKYKPRTIKSDLQELNKASKLLNKVISKADKLILSDNNYLSRLFDIFTKHPVINF